MHHRTLKVRKPGSRDSVLALIHAAGQGHVVVEIAPIAQVQEDNPPFADASGLIRIGTKTSDYLDVVANLEAYLDALFENGPGEVDEAYYTSLGAGPPTRRNSITDTKREISTSRGSRRTKSVSSSPRGDEQADGSDEGATIIEVAKSGDPSPDAEDSSGD